MSATLGGIGGGRPTHNSGRAHEPALSYGGLLLPSDPLLGTSRGLTKGATITLCHNLFAR
jgi:hypothetical protein